MNKDFRITTMFDRTNFEIWHRQLQVVLDANNMGFTLIEEEKWSEANASMYLLVSAALVRKSYTILLSSLTKKYQIEVRALVKPWEVVEHIKVTRARESLRGHISSTNHC